MVYIHTKRIGNNKYYTLRISIRKGDKVITKDLANLGDDTSKINIDDLERKYKKEIKKSYSTIKKFLDSNYYIEKAKNSKLTKIPYFTKEQQINIEAVLLHFNSKFLKADKLTKEEIFESFLINFAVNSTSIEGNTITLKQANRLFKEDIIPKNKTLREVHDLVNTKKVLEFLRKEKPSVDLDLIIKIHDQLLENIDKRKGLRSHDIKIFGQFLSIFFSFLYGHFPCFGHVFFSVIHRKFNPAYVGNIDCANFSHQISRFFGIANFYGNRLIDFITLQHTFTGWADRANHLDTILLLPFVFWIDIIIDRFDIFFFYAGFTDSGQGFVNFLIQLLLGLLDRIANFGNSEIEARYIRHRIRFTFAGSHNG